MTSQRQKQANRGNAQRSTGPRTAAGRAMAAQNARHHGLSVALPAEVMAPLAAQLATILAGEGMEEPAARRARRPYHRLRAQPDPRTRRVFNPISAPQPTPTPILFGRAYAGLRGCAAEAPKRTHRTRRALG